MSKVNNIEYQLGILNALSKGTTVLRRDKSYNTWEEQEPGRLLDFQKYQFRVKTEVGAKENTWVVNPKWDSDESSKVVYITLIDSDFVHFMHMVRGCWVSGAWIISQYKETKAWVPAVGDEVAVSDPMGHDKGKFLFTWEKGMKVEDYAGLTPYIGQPLKEM